MDGVRGIVAYDITAVRGPLANAFVILLNALFFNIKLIGLHDVYPKDFSDYLLQDYEDIFDFIIVGAGSSGCSLANRLTEEERWSVLLIEAGDYPSITTEVPGFHGALPGTAEDWQFFLEKDDRACQAFDGQVCTITRGKVLGGTSTINNLIYSRGTTQDYDSNEFDSWGSNISYAIFDRLENYQGPQAHNVLYGHTGLIRLEHANFTGTPKPLLMKAYKSVGLSPLPRRNNIGFEEHLVTKRLGERTNMAKNFLTPIKERPNLFFSKNTETYGIGVTEPVDRRANGVNVTIRGSKLFIRARKEVILTAGAINNAKLLLLSGIGPREYLESKGIQPYVNIPGVGKNVQFHLLVPLYVAFQPSTSCCARETYTEKDLVTDTFNYILHREGNFSHTDVNGFVTYISTKKAGATLPNIGIHHKYFKVGDRGLEAGIDSMRYHPKIAKSLVKYNRERVIIVFIVKLLYPVSRGEILLNDTHHLSNPRIIPRFMSDATNTDYETMLSGFDFVTNLTDSMTEERAEFLNLDIPNCRNFKFCTASYVKCYIQNMAFTSFDVAGSTFMGPDCDEKAVVKENLEVRGIRCLRVADSSAMNNIPIGNSVATDAMMGFKMAEILKEKWLKDYRSPYIPQQQNLQV